MSSPFWQNPLIREPLAISFGAINGALCRHYVVILMRNMIKINFPLGTLFVNITGSFLMGVLIGFLSAKIITLSPELKLMLSVGFLGAFTTFSSYELDTILLLEEGQTNLTILYWLGSPILGFIAIKLGMSLTNIFNNY